MKLLVNHTRSYDNKGARYIRFFGSLLILAAAWLFVGWGVNPSEARAATCTSFTATDTSITQGQSVTLSWSSSGGTSWGIDPNIGTIGASGSKVVTPSVTTTYTFVVNFMQPGSCSRSVTVTVVPPTPICDSFTVSPSTINAGQSTTLSWSSRNGTAWGIDPNIGTIGASGSRTVTPTSTTTYTFLVTRSGTTPCMISRTVTVNATSVTCDSFTANPSTITQGQSTTLSWSSTGGSNWGIDPSIGAIQASGSRTVTPTATTTYTFIVNMGSSSQCMLSRTVTVVPAGGATCTAPARTPEFSVAVVGQGTTSSSITVPSGTSSVGLEYRWSGLVCRTDASPVSSSWMYVGNATIRSPNGQETSIPSMTGRLLELNFSWVNGDTDLAVESFTAAPTGGFTQSGTYTVTVTGYPLNYFPVENKHICVVDVTREVGGSWAIQQCSTDVRTYTINVTVTPPPPDPDPDPDPEPNLPTCSLTASDLTINSGESVTLYWSGTNATSIALTGFGRIGPPPNSGTKTVFPTSTTGYTLTVTGTDGSISCPVNITVNQLPNPYPPPTCTIFANPGTVPQGGSSRLTWVVNNVTSASLNGVALTQNELADPNGRLVYPTGTTRYTLTVSGQGGSNSCGVWVYVQGSPEPVPLTCTIIPEKITINQGQSVDFEWSSTAATTATWDDGSGPVAVNVAVSRYPVSPSSTTTYTLVVYGPAGSETCPATVTVDEQPPSFVCDAQWYQTVSGVFSRINLETGQRDTIKDTGNSQLNAIGYNVLDNYVYGIAKGPRDAYLARIDNSGNLTILSESISPAPDNIRAGDMDASGNLWFMRDNLYGSTITRMNVITHELTEYSLSTAIPFISDLVYSDKKLYGIIPGANNLLAVINIDNPPSKGGTLSTVTRIVSGLPAGAPSNPYVSGWSTIDGKLYFHTDISTSGHIFRIDGKDSTNPRVGTRISFASLGNRAQTDGASCPNARDPFEKVNYPYLRVNGSDVIAGGVFAGLDDDRCKIPDGIIDTSKWGRIRANGMKQPTYNPSKTDDILAGSSSAQYGAFAFGTIDSGIGGTSSFFANNGYYRQKSGSDATRRRDILFANDTSSTYGNYYQEQSVPCVNVGRVNNEATDTLLPNNVSNQISSATGKKSYKVSGDVTIASSGPSLTVPTSNRITLIVDGSVRIATNIEYGSITSANGIVQTPSLTIIAKKGISVREDVTKLSGYYIAYNSSFNTCYPATASTDTTPRTGYCSRQLIVNGGMAGKTIEWRRNFGTLNGQNTTLPNTNPSSHCAVTTQAGNVQGVLSALDACAAERIDFSPSYYFANPFSQTPEDVYISGNPLNSTELPPIY